MLVLGGRPGGVRGPVGRTPGGVQEQLRAKILAKLWARGSGTRELESDPARRAPLQARGGGSLRAFRRAMMIGCRVDFFVLSAVFVWVAFAKELI